MTLEEAYSVGKKYGFTFNGIGPSFSFINNKVGVCLNLLDKNYGYLKRNFTFDNINELDNFLKKYRFYIKNKENENIFVSLDNYEKENPTIYYSFDIARENKRKVDYKNKVMLVDDIKYFLKNFYVSLESILTKIEQKFLIETDYYNKLNYYKKLLHQVYNKPYKDDIINVDDYKLKKILEMIDAFKKGLDIKCNDLLKVEMSLSEVELSYKEIMIDCQKILVDTNIIEILYEKKKIENNIVILKKMTDYLTNNPELSDDTQNKLQEIKSSALPIESFEEFKKSYENKILEPYLKLDINNVLNYNYTLYGKNPITYEIYKEKQNLVKKDFAKIKESYNNLSEESKRGIILLYSPLRPILNYIIEQAYERNTSFDFEKKEFKKIYNKVLTCLASGENLVFKLKYFKDIKVDTYDLFIKSLVKIAKTITTSYLKLPFELKFYSLNYDECLITGSDNVIQKGDNIVRIIEAKTGSYIIYSPLKIIVNSNNLFELDYNDNIIYFPSFVNTCVESDNIVNVNLFEEGYSVINVSGDNLLVVTNFELLSTTFFADCVMSGK